MRRVSTREKVDRILRCLCGDYCNYEALLDQLLVEHERHPSVLTDIPCRAVVRSDQELMGSQNLAATIKALFDRVGLAPLEVTCREILPIRVSGKDIPGLFEIKIEAGTFYLLIDQEMDEPKQIRFIRQLTGVMNRVLEVYSDYRVAFVRGSKLNLLYLTENPHPELYLKKCVKDSLLYEPQIEYAQIF